MVLALKELSLEIRSLGLRATRSQEKKEDVCRELSFFPPTYSVSVLLFETLIDVSKITHLFPPTPVSKFSLQSLSSQEVADDDSFLLRHG